MAKIVSKTAAVTVKEIIDRTVTILMVVVQKDVKTAGSA